MIQIAKNSREALRLSVDEFQGLTLLSCRVWFQPKDGGNMRPGRDGFAISISKIGDVIAALQDLEKQAKDGGLL